MPAHVAECPLWIEFLDQATEGDSTLQAYLQIFCGYILTGDTREHAMLFLHGPGGNGKSVFLNTLSRIMGTYAATAAMNTFTASPYDRHSTDLAMLAGKRLVTASETEEGTAWAESRIKQITGGDPVTARFMRQDFFTYSPGFKLIIAGNHQPVLRNVGESMRRRLNVIGFKNVVANPDRELEEKLRTEYPQILKWMIDGCLEWQRSGLNRPDSIAQETSEYLEAEDVVGLWIEQCCEVIGHTTLCLRQAKSL